jgi:serpin B
MVRSWRSRSLPAAVLPLLVTGIYAGVSAGAGPAARGSSGAPAGAVVRYAPGPATAAFGLDLMRRLGRGNLVFSPDSVASALAMAGTGAAGTTAAQIATVLRLPSPASFGALGALQRGLEGQPGGGPEAPTLDIANALFLQSGFAVRQPFLEDLASGFQATPQDVDFAGAPAAAAETVNTWVSSQTQGLIEKIVGALEPTTRLLLANAVYLKAVWQTPFKQGATENGTFHAPTGAVRTELMHQTAELPYTRTSGYEALALPYAGSHLSLLVLLPRRGGTGSLLSRLSAPRLGAIAAHLERRPVDLTLPRFHVTLDTSLNAPLERLGITDAFGPRADFAPITNTVALQIGAVDHAADFTVDEEGTVAAAATVVTVEATSAMVFRRTPVAFDADRPFLFFLRDGRTGAVLFAGRLSDPATAGSG